MAKLTSSFKNMVIALFGVTLIASASLGLVNDVTRAPIAKAELEKQTKAIAAVLPEFEQLGTAYKVLPGDGKDSIEIFPAFDINGQLIASAVKTYTYDGFSGYIEVMVGIDNSGKLSGFRVLKHAETPGLGSKMDSWFSNTEKPGQNVVGRSLNEGALRVSNDGGSVDAITAATITSRAFLSAVNRAYEALNSEQSAQINLGGEAL